jgi:two-component system, chemotaxis family, CheB/CheR fusion protein
VGVGASAGGIEAFTALLKELPADTDLAFVLIQHLAPTHTSMLAEILQRASRMPVLEVRDEPVVCRNCVYVIPPGRVMTINRRRLALAPRGGESPHHPIDAFFDSLAASEGHRSIGVVLSGTANDGTAGLAAIKAAGGITIAQDRSALYDGMPRSAISAGRVDLVLPPAGIAGELVRIARHPYLVATGGDVGGMRPSIRSWRRCDTARAWISRSTSPIPCTGASGAGWPCSRSPRPASTRAC